VEVGQVLLLLLDLAALQGKGCLFRDPQRFSDPKAGLASRADLMTDHRRRMLTMNDMLSTFPSYAPWIIPIATMAWVAKQFSDISNAVPRGLGGRSLRRLRAAKETADLATPGTPEHGLFAERHRKEAIRHASMVQAPPLTLTWILVSTGVVAGGALIASSRDDSMLATFVVYNIVSVGPLVTLEREAFKARRRIRAYCAENPEGDLGAVLEEIRREVSGPLLGWIDSRKTRNRNQIKPSVAANHDSGKETGTVVL
jgi:hypothetical protein